MNAQLCDVSPLEQLVGESACIARLREQMVAAASCDVNLLLEGESGTGKELISSIVHKLSGRSGERFVGVNCAAIHESLLESELFGHEAGAFTGALHATLGFFRSAEGGTILLDEVGDMSASLQSKMLRVLDQHAVTPVGGTEPVPINVRVIAATHRNLANAVATGDFRQDLYYRLNVIRLTAPPLRRRPTDIPLLVDHMLQQIAETLQMPLKRIAPDAMDILTRHDWPGNVRQLGNVIQRAYILGSGQTITADQLPAELFDTARRDDVGQFPTLRQTTRAHVMKALATTNGAHGQAADLLGIHRKSLWRMLRRYRSA